MNAPKINWSRTSGNIFNTKIKNNIYGLFYDSMSRSRHISKYVPYDLPPQDTLCSKFANFSAAGEFDKICNDCLAILNNIKAS